MTLLRAAGVTKRYGAVAALGGIDLAVEAGEIHALLGENGAGKTTLVKILGGLEPCDQGTLTLAGEPFAPRDPRDAIGARLAVVHQHDTLIDALTVAENVELALRRCGRWHSREALRASLEKCARDSGFELPEPDRRAGDLSIGERQRVEIARALAIAPRVLVLDEPTASLAPLEAAHLLVVLRAIAARGVAIVFISHYLREVLEIADRVTVLRGGRVVLTAPRATVTYDSLAHAMVGDREAHRARPVVRRGPPRLELDRVSARGDTRASSLADVSLRIHGGECVGVAGVAGNGQRTLAGVIAGTHPIGEGTLAIDGVRQPSTGDRAVAMRRASGLAIVPEDRRAEGLALDLSLAENLLLSERVLASIATRRGWLAREVVERNAAAGLARFSVTAPASTPARALSGGNQQRVVLARELEPPPSVALLVQPTRGLDLKATAAVHSAIHELRETGAAILLVSTDLDEVRALSDRIVVLFRGRIQGEFDRDADLASVSRAMTGGVGPS